ncbi:MULTISPECIES: hypothetical protein [unclassified Micromonospora]|uniref:hypothetical protein n=1 Tax=unclassified Micromonospora TaxID=2617518 RepID=UPI00098D2911|nr:MULTISPECIES: hypothetical protein [unclassified Micromonospora]MDI5938196.1 hypothetical protein [Micromonospora sp. DH15]OON29259.1 hypothetical protein BSA16_22350 [Micromonospora sp. Rc5]
MPTTTHRRIGRLARATAALATATAVLATATPAQAATATPAAVPHRVHVATIMVAASSTQPFSIPYGASITEGTVTFYNRSLDISGYVKAVSASRTVEFIGYNGNLSCYFDETRTASAGTTRTFGFGETCDVAGGFAAVDVYFPV